MEQGHHGANHPVKDLTTGKVEIVSMNHGFTVDRDSLPANAEETHVCCSTAPMRHRADRRPVFAVQHHPEASPGPQDSHYLFARFVEMMEKRRAEARDLRRSGAQRLGGGRQRQPRRDRVQGDEMQDLADRRAAIGQDRDPVFLRGL